jgi:hypothetical protein
LVHFGRARAITVGTRWVFDHLPVPIADRALRHRFGRERVGKSDVVTQEQRGIGWPALISHAPDHLAIGQSRVEGLRKNGVVGR